MFELLILVTFAWLFVKTVGLAFRVTWGLAKLVAVILFVVALPAMIGGLLLASGVILLLPLVLVTVAFGILSACL